MQQQQNIDIAVIFCGKGKQIVQAEKDAYAKGVNVYFQQKPWADQNFCMQLAMSHLKDISDTYHLNMTTREREDIFLLFADKLESQT